MIWFRQEFRGAFLGNQERISAAQIIIDKHRVDNCFGQQIGGEHWRGGASVRM